MSRTSEQSHARHDIDKLLQREVKLETAIARAAEVLADLALLLELIAVLTHKSLEVDGPSLDRELVRIAISA
eukprot:SAG11_NODE_1886_length_4117_cov_2.494027_4_plen_72_part_00